MQTPNQTTISNTQILSGSDQRDALRTLHHELHWLNVPETVTYRFSVTVCMPWKDCRIGTARCATPAE